MDNGAWPLGQPLFHYPTAGNAYCYTFETLTELLRPALYEVSGTLLRDLLLPHLDGLMKAFRHAQGSARPLADEGLAFGWSSGHHPHRTKPEGWATAAVFSYIESLRRLLGKWTHDAAAHELRARPPLPLSPSEALTKLQERGNTWRSEEGWSVAEQLATLFLHPIASRTEQRGDPIDPDIAFIRTNQARSAILFGPPGTGKTTLVEALAAALGWKFIPIHASEFLSRGMDHVPARADEIFERLMELDHCVVFFDEIDELLRERQKAETDPFGRFLTTSMLPKVAQLWDQRRILFFVATNDIARADRAIKRSQRFDAAIFVPPPSLDAKLERLRDELGARRTPRIRVADVEEALAKSAAQNPLGYLALLRHDQIDELAAKLRATGRARKDLERALSEIGTALSASDWIAPADGQGSDAFEAFLRQRSEERRDYRVARFVWAEGKVTTPPSAEFAVEVSNSDGSYLRLRPSPGRPPAVIRLGRGKANADALFRYFRVAA